MKRSITIEIDCDDRFCEPCRHATNPESYRFCAVFDERIRVHPNAEAIRCDGCLRASLPTLEDMIHKAAHDLVVQAFEASIAQMDANEAEWRDKTREAVEE